MNEEVQPNTNIFFLMSSTLVRSYAFLFSCRKKSSDIQLNFFFVAQFKVKRIKCFAGGRERKIRECLFKLLANKYILYILIAKLTSCVILKAETEQHVQFKPSIAISLYISVISVFM